MIEKEMIVEPLHLSQDELDLCLFKLRRANKLLKKWAKYYGFRKGREFRNLIFKSELAPLKRVIPKGKFPAFRKDVKVILAIRTENIVELHNNTVEMAMLRGFIRLSTKHARRWFHANGGQELEDYESEAALALIDAIYGFIREDIQFTTYAWAVIRNRMMYSSNKLEKLSPFTNADRELLIRYHDAQLDFGQPISFDEIVETLELCPEEISLLNHMLTRVVNESQITEAIQESRSSLRTGDDYTALRRNVRENDGDLSVAASVRSAVERANLSKFEAAVLETSLNPYYGWQTDIAKQHINPTTGKKYTRAGTGVALKNAKSKVRAELEGTKEAAA